MLTFREHLAALPVEALVEHTRSAGEADVRRALQAEASSPLTGFLGETA